MSEARNPALTHWSPSNCIAHFSASNDSLASGEREERIFSPISSDAKEASDRRRANLGGTKVYKFVIVLR